MITTNHNNIAATKLIQGAFPQTRRKSKPSPSKRLSMRLIATRTIAISAAVLTVAMMALKTASTSARIAKPWIKENIVGTNAMKESPAHIGWRIKTTVRALRIIETSSSCPVISKTEEGIEYPSRGDEQAPSLEKSVGSFRSLFVVEF